MGRHCHAALQLHQLRLGNHQHVAEIAQARGIIGLVVQRSEGKLDLPLPQVLEELRDELVCERFGDLVTAEFLLADSAGEIGQSVSQRPHWPDKFGLP